MIKVRAEENAILLWNRDKARTAYVSGEELQALSRWTDGEESGFSSRLKKLGVISDEAMVEIREAILQSAQVTVPLRSFCAPETLHIELTTRCMLNCPQCYKGMKEKGSADKSASNKSASYTELPLESLLDVIRQAGKLKVFQIALGGGEPLLYPYLLQVIREIHRYGMASSVTTSGYSLDAEFLIELQSAGLNHIQISLNGSNETIHARSRDGFRHGIETIELLGQSEMSYGINWVARSDSIEDLPALIELAKSHKAGNINILRYKPSPIESLHTANPSNDQLSLLIDIVRQTRGIPIRVDSAFSCLLCAINGKPGAFTGCGAGRRFMVLDAEGYFRPCSHIDLREKSSSILEVWKHSEHLAMFRSIPDSMEEPCRSCKNLSGCCGCRAVVLGKGLNFYAGEQDCWLFEPAITKTGLGDGNH